MTKIKLEEHEIKQLKESTHTEHTEYADLGVIEYNLKKLEHQKIEAINKITQSKELIDLLLKKLQEKHGPGTLNLETGEFTTTK